MSKPEDNIQPIVRRKRRAAHAHHGGAWKIAYADFVTAMMAFFLLMWLLGSTTKGELMGIADFFQTPLQVALFGGKGAGDSTSILQGGGQDLSRTAGQVMQGDVEEQRRRISMRAALNELDKTPVKSPVSSAAEAQPLLALKSSLEQSLLNNPAFADFGNQIRLAITQDGLEIVLLDEQSRPMFDTGSAVLAPYAASLLRQIAATLAPLPNKIIISGHTDSAPYRGSSPQYSNWELSADRALSARRELVQAGLAQNRFSKIIGHADSQLIDPDPLHPSNRRISIMVANP